MTMNLRIELAVVACLGFAACNGVDGTFVVSQNLTVVNAKKKTITVAPGQYTGSVSLARGGSEFEFAIKGVAGKTQKVRIKLPKGEKVPTSEGPIELKAAEIGQPFDVRGNVDTQVTESDEMSGTQSCPIAHNFRVCDSNGCRVDSSIHYGTQAITYHYENTTETLETEFLDAKSGATLATFSGEKDSSDQIIDSSGDCCD
jgi:hypothetical protein